MSNGDVGAIRGAAPRDHKRGKVRRGGDDFVSGAQQLGLPRELSDALVRPYSEARRSFAREEEHAEISAAYCGEEWGPNGPFAEAARGTRGKGVRSP